MKFMILSDLQGLDYRQWIEFLNTKHDVAGVLLLGDIDILYLQKIKEKFEGVPICGVHGNHDYRGDLEYCGIPNVHGKQFGLGDFPLTGLEGCVRYKKEDAPLFTQEEASVICNELPHAEILISHNSPFGIHDKEDCAHVGFKGIVSYLERVSPKFVFHGHQHRNVMTMMDDTLIVSVFGGIIFDTKTNQVIKVLHVED